MATIPRVQEASSRNEHHTVGQQEIQRYRYRSVILHPTRRLAKEPLQQSAERQQAPGISDARQALQAMKQDEVGL